MAVEGLKQSSAKPEKDGPDFSRAKHDIPYFMRLFLNWIPREDQVPVLSSIKDGAKRILIDKGRRWGGTELCSAIAITLCGQHPNTKCGIFAPGEDELEVFFEKIDVHIKNSSVEASLEKDDKFLKKFSNGSFILGRILSPMAKGKRGRGYDLEIFTEAAWIMDDEMHVVRLGKLDNPGAIEILESSPNGLNHFWRSYNDADFVSFKFPSEMNPKISKKDLKKEREKMTSVQASQELDADFIDDATSPFPQVLIDEAVKTSKIEKLWTSCQDKTGVYVAGLDLGRKRDRSVMFIWQVLPKGNLQAAHIKEFEYNPDDPRFWSKVIDHSEYLSKDFHIQNLLVDCTGLGDKVVIDMKNQFAEHNINTRIEGFNFTYASKNKWEGLINQLALKFERYKIHFPFHLEFVKQLKSIRFNSKKALFEAIGKSPDILMAAAMGAMAMPQTSDFFYSKANEAINSPINERLEEQQTIVSHGGL